LLSESERSLSPRIIFLNQSLGRLFLELAEDVSERLGSSYLFTGTQPESLSSTLILRRAPAYDNRTLLTRACSGTLFMLAAIKEILEVRHDVLLFVVSNPPMMPWLALLGNLVRQQPYIVLVYDIHPELLVNLGWLNHGHPLIRLWRWFNRLAYRRAAHIVTLGEHMAHTLERYLPPERFGDKLSVIPTWVDIEHFTPLDKNENPFALQYKQQDKFTVLYSGNIGFSHDISLMVDAAQELREQPEFHFMIIGHGPGKAELEDRVCSAGLENVTILPFQPQEVLPYSLAMADVAVVSVARGAEGLNMPSKTYYLMAVGAALIGLSQPPNDLSAVIEQYECGVNVTLDDLEGFVAALRRFLIDRAYLEACRQASRDAAVRYFSREVNTRRFSELISDVIGRPNR
jgi:colanic acid biosynthesis glycosyl transferase WcaI